jgi:hypothetical protein
MAASSVSPHDKPSEPDLFTFVNRVEQNDPPGTEVLDRVVKRFPLLVVSAMLAGFIFFMEWSGSRGCCRTLATVEPFAQMWWHFFAYWAVGWPVCELLKWVGERVPWGR